MKLELPFYFKLTVILLGLILFVYAIQVAQVVLVPLTFAFILAILLNPIKKKIEKLRVPPALAIALCILLLFLVISLGIYLISTQIVSFSKDFTEFSDKLAIHIENLHTYIENKFGVTSEKQLNYMRQGLRNATEYGGAVLSTTANTTTGILTAMALMPIYIFFFMYYRSYFKQFLYKLFDFQHHPTVDRVVIRIQEVIQSYIAGLFIVIMIISVLNTVGLMILGVKHAFFFGFFAGFLNIIPFIGVFIGSLLPILYALITMDSVWYAAGVAGIFWFVQILESNFITPNIVGSKVSLNPLAAILALIIGGSIWGTAGMILFIPLTAMIKVIFDEIPEMQAYGFILGEPEKEAEKESNLKVYTNRFIEKFKSNRNYLKKGPDTNK